MKRTTRISAFLLCLCLMASSLAFPVQAADSVVDSVLDFSVTDAIADGQTEILVLITPNNYPDVREVLEQANAQADAYAETLDPSCSEEERFVLRADYKKAAYEAIIAAFWQEEKNTLVTDLGLSAEQVSSMGNLYFTLTPEQIYAAAEHPLVRRINVVYIPDTPRNSVNFASVTPGSLGDPNRDGTINAADGADVLTLAAASGIGQILTEDTLSAADVNGDSIVNSEDAAYLLQYAAECGAGTVSRHLAGYVNEQSGKILRLSVLSPDFLDSSKPAYEVLTSREELKAILQNVSICTVNSTNALGSQYPLTDEESRAKTALSYSEDFFRAHDLIAVWCHESSNSIWHELEAVRTETDGSLTIALNRMEPVAQEQMEGHWLLLIETNKINGQAVHIQTTEILIHDIY